MYHHYFRRKFAVFQIAYVTKFNQNPFRCLEKGVDYVFWSSSFLLRAECKECVVKFL